ncbi:N-acylneuraminate cytidylyltransferase [Fodinibius roseus]|uniref:N-acylneuraminate cytidylyltransferase n=1 Tax=Fodinibius roseus TaxID=1194090 RepID=A0A1M5J146_9BACT|nr:pseudaminic acid cytidylyltransferase [Fodinibius roseus]SHG34241.1 N-acylneuraminate cytidylyltransferase [Fodinibius roseus]
MKNLAIIPARGGSKRIPRKNIKDFLGKPIIAYSIETTLESGLFDEVMVSTDDEEISTVAKKYGANIPFMRSDENADDYATTVDVLLEVIEEYRNRKVNFENICCIYPTAPFTTPQDLKRGLDLLENSTSVLPVVEFEFPVQRALKKEKNRIHYVWPEHETSRSQDLESYYHDAGQWYWIENKSLLREQTLITSNCKAIEKNKMAVQDIDILQDWELAKMKYSYLNNK